MRFSTILAFVAAIVPALSLGFNASTLSPPEHRHRLAKRYTPYGPVADDATWEDARCKGQKLLAIMLSDDATAGLYFTPQRSSASSNFQRFPEDFQKWGWWHIPKATCDMSDATYGMQTALSALGVSAGPNWKCYETNHGNPMGQHIRDQTYVVDGRTYRATNGNFKTAINVNEGVIMSTSSFSPKDSGALITPKVTDSFPKLQKASDIIYGQWYLAAGEYVANVRYIISWYITNDRTQYLVRRALQGAQGNTQLRYYPGQTFTTDTPAGLALLGSPNGVGAAYFLAQHKATLGQKRIYAVSVFTHSSISYGQNPVLLFYVA